jgi:hypothetical protein
MNAMAAAHRQDLVSKLHNFELLGEIITWDLSHNTKVRYADLVQALEDSGLETKVARALLPRYAFSRAANKMAEQRIIRFKGQTQNKLAFQLTKEYLDSAKEQFIYDFEATLLLEKDTGAIEVLSSALTSAECQSLAEHAARLLNEAMDNRTTTDVTNVIKRLFDRQADLFPVRNAGSVYFVPNQHVAFVDKVEQFVSRLNGNVNRFPVPAGTQRGDKSVQEAVTEGMQQVVGEFFDALSTFGTDTRPSTVTRALDRIEKARFKLESYKVYLADERDQLEEKLRLAEVEMNKKLQEILTAKAAAKES